MTRLRSLLLVGLMLTAAAGCGDDDLPTTPTPQGPTSFTQVFSGTLQPATSQTFAFSLASSVPVRLTLGSLTDANENPLSTPVTIVFGRPAGTGCGALHSATVQAGLATHLLFQPASGTYCVAISDSGQLSSPASFGVRITQGEPSSTASAGTDTYTSVLFPGGFTSRTFEASAAGTVTVVVDTITPGTVASVNVGVGFPRFDGGGCQLTRSFTGTRGAQVAVPVEIGTYCVKVSDPGTLTGQTTFSIRIIHP